MLHTVQLDIIHSKSELQFGVIPYGLNGINRFEPISHKLNKKAIWKPEISFKKRDWTTCI